MTAGTAPLIDRQRDEVEAAADAATIAGLRKNMLDHLTRVVAEQMLEIRSLREVAVKGSALMYYRSGHDVVIDDSLWDPFEQALDALYDAGYLPAKEETRP